MRTQDSALTQNQEAPRSAERERPQSTQIVPNEQVAPVLFVPLPQLFLAFDIRGRSAQPGLRHPTERNLRGNDPRRGRGTTAKNVPRRGRGTEADETRKETSQPQQAAPTKGTHGWAGSRGSKTREILELRTRSAPKGPLGEDGHERTLTPDSRREVLI